jgi:hypothetical protein
MKSIITKLSFLLLILVLTGLFNSLQAQPIPPRRPTDSGVPIGGNAPIDGGLSIMIILSAAYGTKKYFLNRKNKTF